MVDPVGTAAPDPLLGPPRSARLRLVRATSVTLGADPALTDLYRARYEGTPPRVRAQGGTVTIEYGPRFRPGDWGRQAADVRLNPSIGWRIEARRGLAGLRADLSGLRLLGLEVEDAASGSELTVGPPAGPVLLRFASGAREVTIHRPVGVAARLKVSGGANGLSFDDQTYKAVAGEGTWKSADFDQAADRYDVVFARGVRNVTLDVVELPAAAGHGAAKGARASPEPRDPEGDQAGGNGDARAPSTDIVGSTQRAQEAGDRRWRELLEAHDEAARRLVAEEGGRFIKSTGDGVLAVFDGPGRAIRCALALRKQLLGMGMQLRAGIHTGELDLSDDDVGGIAVHIGARIMAAAEPGEVLVSRTVRDLVTGSDIALEDRGTHALKGLEDPWHLFAAG